MMWRLGLGFWIADEGLDFVVLVVGEDADHSHHAHHAGGPVGREAVGFRLGNGGVHGHFHEGVLGKTGDGVGVIGDGRVMNVFDANVACQGFHLAESARIGGVGRLDLPIAKQVHHAIHHVVREVAVNHPGARIFGVELDDFRLSDTDQYGVCGIPGGFGSTATFGASDDELIAVKVDGVMIHAKIDEAEADAGAETDDEGRSHRRDNTIHGEPVEFHAGGIGNGVVGENGPLL